MPWTQAQLDALAAGVPMEQVKAMASTSPESLNTEATVALAAAEASLVEANTQVTALTETNATLTASNETLTAQVAELQASVDAGAAMATAMTSAIMATIKTRAVVLGATAPEKYDNVEAMMAAYEDLDTQFKAKFKAGPAALPTNKPAKDTAAPLYDSATLDAMRGIKVPTR